MTIMQTYITVRVPLRVSFLGGGTDYPEYFANHPAAVLGMAINRYVYVSALRRPAFRKHEFTISYSTLERVSDIRDIRHPAVRVALEYFQHMNPLDISTMADLPAQTGLGSSASFMVGLIHLLSTLNNQPMTKLQIAQLAVDLELNKLGHVCGVQDQLHAAFGGLNYFELTGGRTRINPLMMTAERLRLFLDSLVLVFTGQTRSAPAVLREQMARTQSGHLNDDLQAYYDMAKQGVHILEDEKESSFIRSFGELMHEGWQRKCSFSNSVTNSDINDLYNEGRARGAYGGKLCGAGGGGFILFVVPPEKRTSFISSFEPERILEVDLDTQGTTILTQSSINTVSRHTSLLGSIVDAAQALKNKLAVA